MAESHNKMPHSNEKGQAKTTGQDMDESLRHIAEHKKKQKGTQPVTPFTGDSEGGKMKLWGGKSG